MRGISNWGGVFLDEYDDWEEDIFPTIIRPNLAVHKAKALVSGTPKGYRNLYKLEDHPDFKCFHFTSYDNPDLDRQELESMVREYQEYGEDYFRQEIMAEYVKPYGTVYSEWNMSHYQEIPYDSALPLHVSMDFGVNDPTAIVWIQPYQSETRVIDYYEASDASIEHFISTGFAAPYVHSLPGSASPTSLFRTASAAATVPSAMPVPFCSVRHVS